MPEYGRAVTVRGAYELSLEQAVEVQRTVKDNYKRTKELHPEFNLPDTFEMRRAPEPYQVYAEYTVDEDGASHGVPGTEIKGLFEHQFGWYVNVED